MAEIDPGLLRDLTEARADLARHGVVIIRTIETDLKPALISEAKGSMASSPKGMAKMDEDELDDFLEKLRKTADKSIDQLRSLYVRLLAKLGKERPLELVNELDGIEQLFKWSRIAKAVEPVNEKLVDSGFRAIDLAGPEDLSQSFRVELEEKWPGSFDRLRSLITEAAAQMAREETQEKASPLPSKTKKKPRRG